MKYLLTIILLIGFGITTQAQDIVEEEKVHDFAEVMPQYPGGINALRKEVQMKYRIPRSYLNKGGYGGTLTNRFVIETDGSIGEIKVLKGIDDCPECSQAAIDAIAGVEHKFSPGLQDGEPIRVWYTLPIVIKIHSGRQRIDPFLKKFFTTKTGKIKVNKRFRWKFTENDKQYLIYDKKLKTEADVLRLNRADLTEIVVNKMNNRVKLRRKGSDLRVLIISTSLLPEDEKK